MSFTLPELPWSKDALAPFISEETINFHYGKHHQGYVTKLNTLVKDTPKASSTLEDLIKTEAAGPIFNCAAQTWNHTFYWQSMGPNAGGEPTGPVKDAIVASFGDWASFRKQFSDAAAGHFGSGWAWLVLDPTDRKLKVVQTHDAACPIKDGKIPILTCDVWEHAYYIDYRNDRPKYVETWWNTVNWKFANQNITSAKI